MTLCNLVARIRSVFTRYVLRWLQCFGTRFDLSRVLRAISLLCAPSNSVGTGAEWETYGSQANLTCHDWTAVFECMSYYYEGMSRHTSLNRFRAAEITINLNSPGAQCRKVHRAQKR